MKIRLAAAVSPTGTGFSRAASSSSVKVMPDVSVVAAEFIPRPAPSSLRRP